MLHLVALAPIVILGVGFASLSLAVRRSHATFSPLTAGLASPLLRYNLSVSRATISAVFSPYPATYSPMRRTTA